MVVAKIFLPSSAGYLTLSVSSSLELSKLKAMIFQRVRKKYGTTKKKKGSFGSPGGSGKAARSPRWIQRLMKKSAEDYKLKWHLESDIKGLSSDQLSCVISNESVTVDVLTTVRMGSDAAGVISLVSREQGEGKGDVESKEDKSNSEDVKGDGKKDLAPNATWTRPIELELLEISKMDGGADDGRYSLLCAALLCSALLFFSLLFFSLLFSSLLFSSLLFSSLLFSSLLFSSLLFSALLFTPLLFSALLELELELEVWKEKRCNERSLTHLALLAQRRRRVWRQSTHAEDRFVARGLGSGVDRWRVARCCACRAPDQGFRESCPLCCVLGINSRRRRLEDRSTRESRLRRLGERCQDC